MIASRLPAADNLPKHAMTMLNEHSAARRGDAVVDHWAEPRRDRRLARWLDDTRGDIVHGVRALVRNKMFAFVSILTLALGIGANAAIFSVVNAVLLKPLPYPDPERLVQLLIVNEAGPISNASIPKFALWREMTDVFEVVAGYNPRSPGLSLTGGSQPLQIRGLPVTAEYFRLFGARTIHGRTFTPEEDLPNGPQVAVLSHGLWVRRYGGDPSIVGGSIEIDGVPRTVVGVMDPSFVAEPPPDVWLPFQFNLNSTEQVHFFQAAARLRPGVSLEDARAQLKIAEQRFRERSPANAVMGPKDGFSAQLLREQLVGDVRPSLLVLSGAVAVLGLIASANVATLLLIRATGRRRELAVRAAIGADRSRLVRQLLTETMVLFIVGGALGLVMGFAAVRVLLTRTAGSIPPLGGALHGVTLDPQVIAFTFGLTIVFGFLCGAIPAFGETRASLAVMMKDARGAGQSRWRSILVASEVGLSVVLLVCAALLVKSFIELRRVSTGFNSEHVLTLQMSMTAPWLTKTAGLAGMVRDGVARIETIPGVAAVAASNALPLDASYRMPIQVVGRPLTSGVSHGPSGWSTVSPQFFDVLRIPLRRGRLFTDADNEHAAPVAIVNETFARQFFPRQDALGAAVIVGRGLGPQFYDTPRQIVGVIGDIRDQVLRAEPRPILYIPQSQVQDGFTNWNVRIRPFHWLVRGKGDPRQLSQAIQNELRLASRGLSIGQVRTMDEIVERSRARDAFNTLLLTLFAGAAIIMAAVGVYALAAYSVAQRTRELGIMLALGAQRSHVRRLVLFNSVRLTTIGVVCGIVVAFALARLLNTVLFGVRPWDPAVFALVPAALSAVAILATWVPAERAGRVDPLTATRCE